MNNNQKLELVILDDDDLIIEIIRRSLRNDNCDVHGFSAQEDCLAYLSNATPAYLLVDMKMPKVDGMQFINELLNKGFNNTTKIFLCSGVPPEGKVRSQMDTMHIEAVDKAKLCNEAWLRSTLGFSNQST